MFWLILLETIILYDSGPQLELRHLRRWPRRHRRRDPWRDLRQWAHRIPERPRLLQQRRRLHLLPGCCTDHSQPIPGDQVCRSIWSGGRLLNHGVLPSHGPIGCRSSLRVHIQGDAQDVSWRFLGNEWHHLLPSGGSFVECEHWTEEGGKEKTARGTRQPSPDSEESHAKLISWHPHIYEK